MKKRGISVNDHSADKFYPVTWDELHRNGKALAWRLLEKGPWKGLVSITRGGLVPAAIVARELDIRKIETVSAVGYDFDDADPKMADSVQIIKEASDEVGEGEGWLVIDDLVDSGRTLGYLRKFMPKAHYATIYAKPQGKQMVDSYVTEVSQDTWIYFPWDIEPQFTQPIARRQKK